MRIGSYQVLLELGRGGMGAVYLARTVGPGGAERLVAIKRAREPVPLSTGQGHRFLDEVRVTAHVHHANVVGMHQAGSDEQGLYLVFDYVEGESLDGLVTRAEARGERMPVRVVLRVLLDALAGLHAAHETSDTAGRPLGILHRDVSTHNLLVGRDGVTRLADFGIAKSTVSTAVTEQGHVEGKLVYMAPEYVQKLPVDRTLDVYAIGMTLWVALAGREPWLDANPGQVLRSILMEGVPSLRSTGVEIAPELEAIVARACSRDAGRRFQTARQMLDELEAVGKRLDLVASHVEVAGYVESVVGKHLAQRRDAIEVSRSAFERLAEWAPSAAVPAAETASEVVTGPTVRDWEKPLPWKSAIYTAAVLALIAVGFAVFSRQSSREPAEAAVSSSAPSAVAVKPAHSSPPASPAPSPVETPAASPPPIVLPELTARQEPRAPRAQPRPSPKSSAAPARGRLDQISTANPYAPAGE